MIKILSTKPNFKTAAELRKQSEKSIRHLSLDEIFEKADRKSLTGELDVSFENVSLSKEDEKTLIEYGFTVIHTKMLDKPYITVSWKEEEEGF